MNMSNNISDGKYTNMLTPPVKPLEPSIEFIQVRHLDLEELATIPRLRDEYEGELIAYGKECDEYEEKNRELKELFESDCAEAAGIDKRNNQAKASQLFEIAWKLGNGDYYEVWSHYERFSGLLKPN